MPSIRVLVVCTANVCRSVMAGASLRARAPEVSVRTAGLLASGQLPDPRALLAVEELGLVGEAKPSRRLAREDVAEADLIIGMELHHVRDIVVLDRSAFDRSFVLGELVATARERGGRQPDETLRSWLQRMHDGRSVQELTAPSGLADIADPTGASAEAYLATTTEIDGLIGELLVALRPSPGPSVGGARNQPVVLAERPISDATEVLASRLGVEPRLVASWEQAGQEAAASVGDLHVVVVITTEPHGTAMEANRNPAARATVVTNRGMLLRHRRLLDANVLCIPAALETQQVAALADAISASDMERPTGDER